MPMAFVACSCKDPTLFSSLVSSPMQGLCVIALQNACRKRKAYTFSHAITPVWG